VQVNPARCTPAGKPPTDAQPGSSATPPSCCLRARSAATAVCCSHSGSEWSQDRVDLVTAWLVEGAIGGLAQVKGAAAALVAKVGVGSVVE
jgi:hypothetical protein